MGVVDENAAAAEKREQTMRVWDFIITRFDGTKIRLHPQRNKASVEAYSAEGPTEQVHLPKWGMEKRPRDVSAVRIYANPKELEARPQEGLGSSTAQEEKLKFDPGRVNILHPNRSCGRDRPLHQTAVAVVGEHYSRLFRYASRRH